MSVLMVSGCISMPETPSRFASVPDSIAAKRPDNQHGERPEIIAELQARRSVLAQGSSFAAIARAVEASDAGTAEAELRVARLKAEARSKNWLPSIGPSVSLNALGALATSLLVEVALIDHGKRRAEREFAAADVEVAASKLATDGNRRVHQGVLLFVNAEAARGRASVAERALSRLTEFERIMGLRVQGGISNLSDQMVMNSKVAEMQARLADDRSTEAQSIAELSALAGRDMSGLRGITEIGPLAHDQSPLTVVQARAEHARTLAELKVEKAGFKPGLSVGGDVLMGVAGLGVKLGPEKGWSFGSGAEIKALDAAAVASERRVLQVREDAARRLAVLDEKHAGLGAQIARQSELVMSTRQSLDLFERQYKAGQRSLLDLVGQFENLARMERDLVDMRHERARVRLEVARDLGALAEGARL